MMPPRHVHALHPPAVVEHLRAIGDEATETGVLAALQLAASSVDWLIMICETVVPPASAAGMNWIQVVPTSSRRKR